MQNLHQVYQEILDTEKFKTEIQKSKSKFEVKPFVQEWYLVKQIAQMLHPLLSLFSIATGFGFLFYQFASNLNVYAAVIFAIALLIILELMKSLASALTFKRLYLSGFSGINFALLLLLFWGFLFFYRSMVQRNCTSI